MRRGGTIVWALLLIGVGVVLLLRNNGVIPEDVRIWPLVVLVLGGWLLIERLTTRQVTTGLTWPLVLIAIGGVFLAEDLRVIPRRVDLGPILLIAIGLAVVFSAVPDRRREIPFSNERVRLDGATTGKITINHGAGRLVVGSTLEPGVLLEGSFRGYVKPTVRREGGRVDVTIGHRPGAWLDYAFPWNWRGPGPLDWNLGLSRRVPVELEVRSGASSQEIDLTDLTVTDLEVKTGASQVDLRLPSKGSTRARVEAGAAKVRVRVPERMAARIRIQGGVSSVRVDERRFPKANDVYESKGYLAAEQKTELVIEAGAADVEVR